MAMCQQLNLIRRRSSAVAAGIIAAVPFVRLAPRAPRQMQKLPRNYSDQVGRTRPSLPPRKQIDAVSSTSVMPAGRRTVLS